MCKRGHANLLDSRVKLDKLKYKNYVDVIEARLIRIRNPLSQDDLSYNYFEICRDLNHIKVLVMNQKCPTYQKVIKTTIDPQLDQLPEIGARPMELFLKELKENGFKMPPMDVCGKDHGKNLSNHEAIWMLGRSGVKINVKNWETKLMLLLMN